MVINARGAAQGDLRGHLLELMAGMGVRIQKAMDPVTITHVVAADVDCRDSQKLNIARSFQCASTPSVPAGAVLALGVQGYKPQPAPLTEGPWVRAGRTARSGC